MLRSITILTTTRCNLACQHCLHGHELKQQDFPLQLLPKLLQDARILGASHVALTGGEPGLHPQFAAMVKDIVESGYTWSFVSNGQQLQPYLPLIETFGEQLRNVSLSLDGARPQTHDHIRSMGTFEKAVSAAKAFADTGAKLFLSTSLNRVNQDEIEDLAKLAASLGTKTIGFCGTIPTTCNHHLALNDREGLMLYRQITELQKSSNLHLPIRSSLYTRGGVHFCANLGLRELSFNAHGELLFCCDMAEDQGIIGSLHTHTLDELIEKWLQTSSDLQAYRMKRITSGRMGEGFDTCAFCDHYFREQYGRIGRRQFLAAGVLSAAGLALAACAPEAVQSEIKESATLPNRIKTSTETAMLPTTSSTPEPSPTTTDTPEPSATPQFYDTFVPTLSREDVRVDYSPSVVRVGEKLNAAIHLPVQTPGAHGLLFSEVYYVSVEVYTQGASEFEKGPFTGTRVTFKGDAALGGSSQEGSLVINWHNPTYSGEINYIYIFNIYALVNAMRSAKGAKLARLKAAVALQQVTLAGLPDPASQVIFLSNSASEMGGGENESLLQSGDDGTGGSSGGPGLSSAGVSGSSGDG